MCSPATLKASSVVTEKKSAKYRKILFIYGLFKLYFEKKSCRQVSIIIFFYIFVRFLPLVSFWFYYTTAFFSCEYFKKLKELPSTLDNIYYTHVIFLFMQSIGTYMFIVTISYNSLI